MKLINKIEEKIHSLKLYVDSIVDPIAIFSAFNMATLYGLSKISDTNWNDFLKYLTILSTAGISCVANKKIVWPLAKKIREKNLEKAKNLKAETKISSWIKSLLIVGLSSIVIATTFPDVYEKGKQIKQTIYETHKKTTIEELVNEFSNNGKEQKEIKLAEKESKIGTLQRTERWKYLTDKYESLYGLPPFTLYSLIAHESYGDPLCINENDGGAGLIHTQPATAKEMGLKVYQNCNAIRSKEHAKELVELIKKYGNLDSLKKYDERFDSEKLLPKIAELIVKYYKRFNNWDAAIAAIHTGPNGVYKNGQLTKEARRYLRKIKNWKKIRENLLPIAIEDFNKRNWPLTFEEYKNYFKKSNNYGFCQRN